MLSGVSAYRYMQRRQEDSRVLTPLAQENFETQYSSFGHTASPTYPRLSFDSDACLFVYMSTIVGYEKYSYCFCFPSVISHVILETNQGADAQSVDVSELRRF